MSTFFIFEIKGAKEDKIFNFLKGRFSLMGGPIDVISDTYVRLLKIITLQFFQGIAKVVTIEMSKVA